MAGEDFLPVGIKATVVGVDKFLADIRRMQTGVIQFGKTVKDTGVQMQSFSSSVQSASRSSREYAEASRGMITGSRQMTTATRELAQVIAALSSRLPQAAAAATNAGNALSGLKEKVNVVNNSVTRFVNGLATSVQKIGTSSAAYRNQQQVVNQLRTAYDTLKNDISQTTNEHDENKNAVIAAQREYTKSSAALAKVSRQYRQTQKALDALQKEMNEYKAAGASAADVSLRFGATQTQLNARLAAIASRMRTAFIAASTYEAKLTEVRAASSALGGALAAQQGKLAQLGAALSGQSAKLAAMKAGLNLLSGALKGVGIAASASVTGFKLMKGVLTGLITPIKLVNRGFLRMNGVLKTVNKGFKKVTTSMFRRGNSIRFLGTSITFLVSLPIIGFFKGMADAAIEFETAFAGVIRTVDDPALGEMFTLIDGNNIQDLTDVGKNLERGFRDLALKIPITAVELANIGEVAGTLGVRGNKNLITFTETAARLGATTNISAEEAATGLAKITGVAGGLSDAELAQAGFTDAQIAGMNSSERFQASIESIGGVVTDLGNKTRGTESEIINFTRKIAASGNIIGLTTVEMLAFSASFQAVGVDTARGGTAFQKTITQMLRAVQSGGRELEVFASVAGTSIEEFVELFEVDAAEAIRRFIEGLGQSGDQAVMILDELDLADARVMQSILALSSAEGELTKNLALANSELENQAGGLNALMTESERRFSTTANQIQLLKNQFSELGITIGSFLLPVINDLVIVVRGVVEKMTDLSPQIMKFVIVAGLAVAVMGPLITGFGLMLASVGFIGSAISFVISIVLSLAGILGILIIPIAAVVAAVVGLAVAFAASFKKMETFASTTSESLAKSMFRFGRGLIMAFARGMATALIAIVRVLNEIGKVIAKWLKPGSPPKLLPDLDQWGADAMNVYMEGWLSADFNIFNKLADKVEGFLRSIADTADEAGRKNLIQRILGSRKAIAQATQDIKRFGKVTENSMKNIFKAMGTTSKEVKRFILAMVEVKVLSEEVAKAQEKVNAIVEEYEKALKPISDRLKEIDERQQDVADSGRIMELEAILADPRATELVRELANLELEQIGLEADERGLEKQKDAKLSIAEVELEAAELKLEAAEEELAAAEAMLDVTIKNNELLNEMKQAAKEVATALTDALDTGDISGFDEGDLELPGFDDEGGLLGGLDIDGEVDSIVEQINASFGTLVTDIMAEFEPLTGEDGLFAELGDTWAPIFDELLAAIETAKPFLHDFNVQLGIWKTTSQELAESIGEFVDGALYEFFSILIDLGLVEPFGPLAFRDVLEIEGPLSKIGAKIEEVKQAISDFFTDTPVGGGVMFVFETLASYLGVVKDTVDPLKNSFENLKPAFAGFADALGPALEAAEPLWTLLKGIGRVLLTIVAVSLVFVISMFAGLTNALARAIEFVSIFVGRLIEDFGFLLSGIIRILTGIVLFFKGIWTTIFVDTEEGFGMIRDSIAQILIGIYQAVFGFGRGILDIFGIIVAAIAGLFLGFVEGIIKFARNLYDTLVGNSIFTDLMNEVIEIFQSIVDTVIEAWEGFVESLTEFATGIYDAITGAVQLALDWLAELPQQMWDLGADIIGGLVDGIKAFADDPLGAITDVGGKLLGGIKGVLGMKSPSKEMKKVGENIMLGLKKGLEADTKASLNVMRKFTKLMLALTEQMLESMIVLLKRYLPETTALVVAFTTELLALTLAWGRIYSIDQGSVWWAITDAIMKWFKKLEADLAAKIQDILNIMLLLTQELLAIFDALTEFFFNSGVAMIDGMIAGIESRAPYLLAKATGIANDIRDIINAAFEVGSPSKWFFRLGESLMEGWALGMKSGETDVMTILDKIMEPAFGTQRAQPAMPARVSAMPAQPAPVYLGGGGGSEVRNEINMGGQTLNDGLDVITLQLALEQALRNVLQ